MSKKEYTLTGRNSLSGDNYDYKKGDVIASSDYAKLVKRHQKYFSEGRLTLPSENIPAGNVHQKLEELEDRIDKLEESLSSNSAGGGKDRKEAADKAPAKPANK